MTIGQEISKIKGSLKEVGYENIPDSLIYSHWVDARTLFIKQNITRSNKLNDILSPTFTIDFEEVNQTLETSCYKSDCPIWKSKYKIPNTIDLIFNTSLNIYSPVDFNEIQIVKPSLINAYLNNPFKKHLPFVFIINQYLYSYKSYKCLNIKGVWSNPLEWVNIQSKECPIKDPLDLDSFLPEEYNVRIIELVKQSFSLNLKLKEDKINDRNNETQ